MLTVLNFIFKMYLILLLLNITGKLSISIHISNSATQKFKTEYLCL